MHLSILESSIRRTLHVLSPLRWNDTNPSRIVARKYCGSTFRVCTTVCFVYSWVSWRILSVNVHVLQSKFNASITTCYMSMCMWLHLRLPACALHIHLLVTMFFSIHLLMTETALAIFSCSEPPTELTQHYL
jgi:hypothetical protein